VQGHRGFEETATFSKEKQSLSLGEKITIYAMYSLCEMPWALRIAGCFVLSHFIRSHSPRLCDHPGAICLVYGRHGFYSAEFAFLEFPSIQPARKDASSSFAPAWTLLLVNNLASLTPLSISISTSPTESVLRVAFFFASSHHPTGIRSYSETHRD